MKDPTTPHSELRTPHLVREMFSRIAPRYDFLNHLLSMQADRWWRRRVARRFRHILARPEARVLDLCCGTADLALALAAGAGPRAQIIGADFSHPMLERARAKLGRLGDRVEPLVAEADALRLPFSGRSFDLVATAFGFRNLADYHAGLAEIFRVLRPGGEAGILEFSEPRAPLFRGIYNFYFRRVLPRVGGAISGDGGAYQYLTRSVAQFPPPEGLADWMRDAGFVDVAFQTLTGGIACLHTARRP